MTSGNVSQEPISYENEQANERLKDVADFFLVHNRDIHTRCDDTVTRIFPETKNEMILRRSRGYAPSPLLLPFGATKSILACGGHYNNTFALARYNEIYMSHHIGDLENLEALEAFENGIRHFTRLFEIDPKVIACDMHPDYLSTKYAHKLYDDSPLEYRLIPVQHHHAHIASCMADNSLPDRKVIGVAFDGSGFGSDQTVWGGEFLIADYADFERVARLKYLPLPGGETAIREPWRMAAVYLFDAFGEEFPDLDIDFNKRINRAKWEILKRMIREKINSPLTSSMGRLFDAVSSLAGIRDEIHYEGQAAIELEMAIDEGCSGGRYDYDLLWNDGEWIIDPCRIIRGVVGDLRISEATGGIALKFHNTIIELILDVSQKIRDGKNINEVALGGGVFQNIYLTTHVHRKLKEADFEVYIHNNVPTNDGGLCLGQAAVAAARIGKE
jgi:hydrogenase maturation protein HypF